MRGRNELGPQQLGEQVRVDAIGFDFGGRDGLEAGRVRQNELDAEVVEEIGKPIPEAGGFDDGPMRWWERREVGAEAVVEVGDALLFDALADVIVGCDEAVAFVLIDAGEVHGALLE